MNSTGDNDNGLPRENEMVDEEPRPWMERTLAAVQRLFYHMAVYWLFSLFLLALYWCLMSYIVGMLNLGRGDWLCCLVALAHIIILVSFVYDALADD